AIATALVVLDPRLVQATGGVHGGCVGGGRLIVPLVDDGHAVEEDADAVVGPCRDRGRAAGAGERARPAHGEVVDGQPRRAAGAVYVVDRLLAGGLCGGWRQGHGAEVLGEGATGWTALRRRW